MTSLLLRRRGGRTPPPGPGPPGAEGGSGNQGFHSFVFCIGNFHQNKLDTCSKGLEDVEGPDWPRGV